MKKYIFALLIVANTIRPMEVKDTKNQKITSSSVQKTIPMQKKETDPLIAMAEEYGHYIPSVKSSIITPSSIFVINKNSSKPNIIAKL